MLKAKYNPGDKVDYVNEFGAIFRDWVIREKDNRYTDEIRYFIEDSETPWYSYREENLHPAGTYLSHSLDIKLNCGGFGVFSHYDEWHKKVYAITSEDKFLFNAVMLEDGLLYGYSSYSEPTSKLNDIYQQKQTR